MYCAKCGQLNDNNFKFCYKCGAKIGGDSVDNNTQNEITNTNINNMPENCKYSLQCDINTKIEVYEDYIILHRMKAGVTKLLRNAFSVGANEDIILFNTLDIDIQFFPDGRIMLTLKTGKETLNYPLTNENSRLAQEIVNYINSEKENIVNASPEYQNEKWDNIVASSHEFHLCDEILKIDESMDIYNSYRIAFRDLADKYADSAEKEYKKRVNDLNTYLKFLPDIYYKYLDAMATKAMDILVAEGIWSVTKESFIKSHSENFHLVVDYVNASLESVKKTVTNNAKTISSFTSLIPNISGIYGFGVKNTVDNALKAQAYNVVRDLAEESLINNASRLNQAQKAELYNRINTYNLFDFVFCDYWNVFLTLVCILIANGHTIWLPTDDKAITTAKNIFMNLSNPNFPKDKRLDVFLEILHTSPYKTEYMKYMIAEYGETEETTAIINYFGYTDFDNPRIAR